VSKLADRIFESVKAKPGQKARDIATQLGVDRPSVNSVLYGQLKGKVEQDRTYRWYVRDAVGGVRRREDDAQQHLDTPLAKLCRYYLDCLSHDDLGGVSEFASSMYGAPSYVELSSLPIFDENGGNPFDSDTARQLLGRVRRDRNRQTLFLGYPVRLKLVRCRRSNWEGFMVEPLFLFSTSSGD